MTPIEQKAVMENIRKEAELSVENLGIVGKSVFKAAKNAKNNDEIVAAFAHTFREGRGGRTIKTINDDEINTILNYLVSFGYISEADGAEISQNIIKGMKGENE